jgi:hypothetical protein
MRRRLVTAILMVVAACAPASIVEPSTIVPSSTTATTTSSPITTTIPRGPAKVPVAEIKAIADQVLVALGARDIGWEETHGPETFYVSAIFKVDGEQLVLWVVVGDQLEDLLGLFGPSYRSYAQYQPVVVSTAVGDVETYVLPPTYDVDYEVLLARLVGVCGKYQVAIEASQGAAPPEYLERAVLGIDCSQA